jgi:hypothetical protein
MVRASWPLVAYVILEVVLSHFQTWNEDILLTLRELHIIRQGRCVYVCGCLCVRIHVYMHVCMRVCMCVYVCVSVYICMCICIYMYVYMFEFG